MPLIGRIRLDNRCNEASNAFAAYTPRQDGRKNMRERIEVAVAWLKADGQSVGTAHGKNEKCRLKIGTRIEFVALL